MSANFPEDASRPLVSPPLSADERTLYDHPTSDDERYDDGRPSGELSAGDHDILESEDERERLLTQKQEGISGLFSKKKGVVIGKPEERRFKNGKRIIDRKRAQTEEESSLMYEMEEGVGASRSNLSRNSSESDKQRLLATKIHRKVCLIIHITACKR
jgi:hypothetical protein